LPVLRQFTNGFYASKGLCFYFTKKPPSWQFFIVLIAGFGVVSASVGLPAGKRYQNLLMLRIVDNVRTIIERQNEYTYIPDLREYANAY